MLQQVLPLQLQRVLVEHLVDTVEARDDLQAVLHNAQELVGLANPLALVGGEQARALERVQRLQRVSSAHLRHARSEEKLQELHGELNVANPAPAILHVGKALARYLAPLLHAQLVEAQLLDQRRGHVQAVNTRLNQSVEVAAKRLIARHEARFQQRLPLPVLHVVLIVVPVRIERANKRAGLPLGAQAHVDTEQVALRGRPRKRLDEMLADARRGGDVAFIPPVNEDEVNVGGVV